MKKQTLLLTLLITISAAYSQKSWVSLNGTQQPEQATMTIQQSDRAGLTFEINVPGMYLQEITQEDMVFQHISLTDGYSTEAVGRPELPMLHEVIGIPGNQKVIYTIIEMETTKLSGYNIYPFQTPTTDNPGGHDKAFVMDKAFYEKDGVFPAENVVLDQPQIWRDIKLTNLHVTPFSYNPATQELTAITKMVVKVEFSGMDETMSFNPDMELTPKFYNMYESAIPNFGDLGYTLTYREDPGIKYLIITNTEAVDAIQPLVDWKNQMGHKVEVKTIETGFSNPQNFKDYISQLYESDGLEYVLMVGDAYPNGGSGGGPNIVPMYYWSPGGDPSYSDSWYTCLDPANDHYAEIAIGRFVYDANSLDELEIQISKTMTHYLTPDVSSNWGENTILVAHKEQYPGKYTQCCNEITSFNYSIQTPIFEKAYGGEGYTNSQVVEFVNDNGVGIFNYRGHGSQTQLWDWTNSGPSHFTAAEVSQLNNVDQLFVFFDVCCDNMDIVGYNGECLCESFMKHPTASVAVNGAIIPSYTIPNHDYDKEMYKAVFEENITNIGYLTNYANLTVLNVHGAIGMSNVRTYLWLGDASIEPWTMQAMDLSVSHDQKLFLGTSDFAVTVIGTNGPAEGALVCVSNEDNSVYAVAYTDATGAAALDFGGPVQIPGDATVTVTLHNYMPYQAIVPIIPQEGPYVVKDSYELNDVDGGNGNGMMDYAESILMSLSVKNVGIQTAQNVIVTISTEDEYVTVTDSEENYGDVDPDQIVTVTNGFAFDVAEDLPDGHAALFQVNATNGTNNWSSTVVITGHAPVLEMGDFTIADPTGNNNGKLDPGEVATITVNINNNGSADAYDVMAGLLTNDIFVQVTNIDPSEVGDIAAQEQELAIFNVVADLTTPAGHMADFGFDAYGIYNISTSGEFSVVIGQIPVVIIDLDENNNSGPVMQQTMEDMGISAEYVTSIPAELSLYSSAFVCLGIYSSNHVLSNTEGQQLADFLNAGGMLYIEGGDTWYYDDQTAVHDMFNINGTSDGSSDLGTINGMAGTFTEGMSFGYSGENNWIDHIAPIGDAVTILENQSPNYGTAVAYDGGSYKTIGASHEFGGLGDSDASKEELMTEFLSFFEVITTGVTANFSASETQINTGGSVSFMDLSVGEISIWQWEFPGGSPATSTNQNPTVIYSSSGMYDVSLNIFNQQGFSSALTKENYITVLSPETYFTPVWTSPYNPMTFYILEATIDDLAMQAGDEVGLFDIDPNTGNEICVGAGTLIEPLGGDVFLEIIASMDDGSNPEAANGFTPGHNIIYKLWNEEEGEITNIITNYPYPGYDEVFTSQGSAFVELNGYSSITQCVNLTTGWNIMSYRAMPENPDMLSVLEPLINNDILYKVLDEAGGSVFHLPFPPPNGQWSNTIGNLQATEGYYVKVTGSGQLCVEGQPVETPLEIPLTTGWNIISYPCEFTQNALDAFQPLIDQDLLYKVIDEAGGSIFHLPFPPPNGQWSNTIGDLKSGEGYYVKVTANTTLTIECTLAPTDLMAHTPEITEPVYFQPVYENNPYMPMHIVLGVGEEFQPGDEIGIFDGDICVGSSVYSGGNEEFIIVTCSMDDPETSATDGFLSGNIPSVAAWSRQAGGFYYPQTNIIEGVEVFEGLATMIGNLDITQSIINYQGKPFAKPEISPNPFAQKTNVMLFLKEAGEVNLQILTMNGTTVQEFPSQLFTEGNHTIEIDLQKFGGGVYFLMINIVNDNNTESYIQKLIKL